MYTTVGVWAEVQGVGADGERMEHGEGRLVQEIAQLQHVLFEGCPIRRTDRQTGARKSPNQSSTNANPIRMSGANRRMKCATVRQDNTFEGCPIGGLV